MIDRKMLNRISSIFGLNEAEMKLKWGWNDVETRLKLSWNDETFESPNLNGPKMKKRNDEKIWFR